ncbi:MAG: glycosyltransferase [Acidobacteriota bacterium]|nr:glycosyltransferase [Acidobacteriota bacterium]
MKVTIIGPAYPLRGGIAHHVYYLRRELTERGHSVQVISFRKLYPGLLFPGKTELDTSASRLDAKGVSLLSPLNPLAWARGYRAVKSFSPDVVIFQWWHPFFALMVGTLARMFHKTGLKCILECHNVFPHESSPFDRLLLKFAAKPFDSFITHSSSDRSDLLPFAPGKRISVSPLPIPSEFSGAANQTRNGRTILFFGMVRKYKGLDVLLRAMPKVLAHNECRECRLLIAGEFYDSVDKYRKLIRAYGLEQHVSIDNRYIPNEEIAGIFDRVDVLVLPYLNATQSAVAGIALSNALPLIASRSGGLSEIVIENVNGLLFPVGDSDALAEKIIFYFSNNLGPVFAQNLLSGVTQGREQLGKVIEEMVRDDHAEALPDDAGPGADSRAGNSQGLRC